MTVTARERTRQRREKMEQRLKAAGLIAEPIPLQRQIAHAVCQTFYSECACSRAIDKSVCARMEGAARFVIDTVRNHDMKARGGIS